tara:strand:+ start:662 stop:931 length:270 start_codon:yes stop_codon:yes gene_type:complete
MNGGYIIKTTSFDKKKHKINSRRRSISRNRRRSISRNRRRSISGNRRSNGIQVSRRRDKRVVIKGGSDCVSIGYKGNSDGFGLAQYSSN